MCPSHPDPSTLPSCLQTQEIAEQAPPEPNYTMLSFCMSGYESPS